MNFVSFVTFFLFLFQMYLVAVKLQVLVRPPLGRYVKIFTTVLS